jgi:hypothetical protein
MAWTRDRRDARAIINTRCALIEACLRPSARTHLTLTPCAAPCIVELVNVHTPQRLRERDVLYDIDAWDVELVEGEQWGRVLVAQRDFAPGEVVIRSGMLVGAHGAAEFVRKYCAYTRDAHHIAGHISRCIEWAKNSPR